MTSYLNLAVTGVLLFGLSGAGWSQQEVAPPAVPPILEGQRPLERPDTSEPAPPKRVAEDKAKPKAKARAGKKARKQAGQPQNKKKKGKVSNKKGEKGKAKKAVEAKQSESGSRAARPNP